MPYRPPVREHDFLLNDVLNIGAYADLPGFSEAGPEVVAQILQEAGRFTSEVLAPLNPVGDKEGCAWSQDHSVRTPTGFADAYRQMVEGGWPAIGVWPRRTRWPDCSPSWHPTRPAPSPARCTRSTTG